METIEIFDSDVKLSIFLNDNKIYYINYNDSTIDINKYLNSLIMDNPVEFFKKNGNYAILYKTGKHENNLSKKIFRFKSTVVVTSLSALILFNSYMTLKPDIVDAKSISSYSKVEYDESFFRTKIFTSNNLTEAEKLYLHNEDFIEDILPFINSDNYLKYKFSNYFTNISIKPFDEKMFRSILEVFGEKKCAIFSFFY